MSAPRRSMRDKRALAQTFIVPPVASRWRGPVHNPARTVHILKERSTFNREAKRINQAERLHDPVFRGCLVHRSSNPPRTASAPLALLHLFM
jgi:hypothetical protein